MIRPPWPRPAQSGSDDEEEGMIGPPRPPPVQSDDEEEEMIGPPRPPPGLGVGDSGSDEDDEAEEENRYRIPLSNEIVLKGHNKVWFFSSLSLISFFYKPQ